MDYRPWSLKELDTTEQRSLSLSRASLVVQSVKNLSAMQETWVQSLGQEDPLERGRAAHSSVLAWESPVFSPRKDWRATVYRVTKELDRT